MSLKEKKQASIIPSNIECDLANGLSDEQVQKRKEEGLINKTPKKVTKSYFKIIFDNIFNFFNLLLFAIFIFMLTAGFDPRNYAFIYLLLINISIGLFQDIRARKQSDKLKVISSPKVRVIRNGKIIDIDSNELVLSDIVLLESGNQIVADSIVKEGTIEVNEALITGESKNILKKPGDLLYSGSYVTSGQAKVIVDRVGKNNYAESLEQKAKGFKRPKSEILNSINSLFRIIAIVVLTLGTATIVTYIVNKSFENDYSKTVLSFSGSMVSMIPTGMFLLTSLTLAVGVIRLAKKRMLVQELYCIETLARVDTLCFDKTGTLTDGNMVLKDVIGFNDNKIDDIKNVLFTLVSSTKDSNVTANAIRTSLSKQKLLQVNSYNSFNSKRKYSSVSLTDGRTFVLGAKEFLINSDKNIEIEAKKFEQQGYRVLLLCSCKHKINIEEELPSLTPVALIVLEDHIKEGASRNIEWFKNNGVNIKIISGDNPLSVSSIAKKVGVDNAEKYLSLENIELDKIDELVDEYTVFGRVSPEQKERIVLALQKKKHIVGMTGDGVNDILALHAADCSIAMASGSEAARAIAHLVTLDSNFSSLPNVVEEGRRVINNLQRSCSIFLIKTFFAMVLTFVFLIASWFNEGLKYPFITSNMYIWELLTIGFASFFLSLQPNNEKIKNTFIENIISKSVPGAIVQLLFVFILFGIHMLFPSFIDYETTRMMAIITFTVISFYTLVIISIPFDKYRLVLSIAILSLICIFFIIDSCLLSNSFFNINYSLITSNNWWLLVTVLLIALPTYFLIDFIAKKILRKKGEQNENI
ncbi:MAG TPA: ATPase P [Firmicutes bacterium]|nr:ATPase P [Bacillota bacterium]